MWSASALMWSLAALMWGLAALMWSASALMWSLTALMWGLTALMWSASALMWLYARCASRNSVRYTNNYAMRSERKITSERLRSTLERLRSTLEPPGSTFFYRASSPGNRPHPPMNRCLLRQRAPFGESQKSNPFPFFTSKRATHGIFGLSVLVWEVVLFRKVLPALGVLVFWGCSCLSIYYLCSCKRGYSCRPAWRVCVLVAVILTKSCIAIR